MDKAAPRAGTLKLLGGRLSLDFANTADWHASNHPVELLTSYAELVAWGLHVGILTERRAQRLLERAARQPVDAAVVLERSIALREAFYEILSAISHERPPPPESLGVFNAELSRVSGQSRIVQTPKGLDWDHAGGEDALDWILWAVAHDAAALLTSGDLSRVGQCADDRCGWLFLDTSRNRSRRWCSMEDCGNRAKARRHHERSRQLQDSGPP